MFKVQNNTYRTYQSWSVWTTRRFLVLLQVQKCGSETMSWWIMCALLIIAGLYFGLMPLLEFGLVLLMIPLIIVFVAIIFVLIVTAIVVIKQ